MPKDTILVSLDVNSLCTSIPDSEVRVAVKTAFDKYPQKTLATQG